MIIKILNQIFDTRCITILIIFSSGFKVCVVLQALKAKP